ncbi:hypothetical protein BC939DRAFT_437642 [Gamsiella multidivaricata]|uniref:uncharacterized protein n=1 Tax=Gamsiella multidivaricata TaxID=101098 RepID=UPI002220BE90|nr:uncharacterized protein BC939DRAFT_437642 [Gamsiella multidivaricata]KAI7831119.1 hypothetical protein BC939DRAFT_437642 [Gamsiella multidivaricata]
MALAPHTHPCSQSYGRSRVLCYALPVAAQVYVVQTSTETEQPIMMISPLCPFVHTRNPYHPHLHLHLHLRKHSLSPKAAHTVLMLFISASKHLHSIFSSLQVALRFPNRDWPTISDTGVQFAWHTSNAEVPFAWWPGRLRTFELQKACKAFGADVNR